MCWSHWVTLVMATMSPAWLAQPPAKTSPTEEQFREQIRQLDRKHDKRVRLEALKWLKQHAAANHAELALPALVRSLHEDTDSDVRVEVVWDLHWVAKQRGKPCPLALIEAVLDDDVYVRQAADALAGRFNTFAPGTAEVLLRGAWSEDADIRSASLLLLAQAAPRDEKVLAVIETAKQDRLFLVRHNAHCAKFKANHKLGEFLAWMIRLQEDEETVLYPVPADRDLRLREHNIRNLAVIGSAVQIIEWCDTRPTELATALLQLLENRSIVMRRGAARLIGAVVVKVDSPNSRRPEKESLTKATLFLFPEMVSEAPNPSGRPEPPAEKSKVAVYLEKGNVRQRLEKLSKNDPDAAVRLSAQRALARLAPVEYKKP